MAHAIKKHFSFYILSFIAVISIYSYSHACDIDDQVRFGKVTKVTNGVYAGSAKLSNGQVIYCGMERLEESNYVGWKEYKKHTLKLVREGGGVLHYLAATCEPTERTPYNDQIHSLTGFTQEEYIQYLDLLYERNYGSKKAVAVNNIASGANALDISISRELYVTYLSKKPVTGLFPFSQTASLITLKEFNRIYDDIIICVGTFITPKRIPLFINRGIFKNPKHFVEGGFPDISMLPHAFSFVAAEVVLEDLQRKPEELEWLSIKANIMMAGIIEKKLKPEDYIKGINNVPSELQNICSGGDLDIHFLLKSKPVERFYLEAQ